MMSSKKPAYLEILENDEFPERVSQAYANLSPCVTCARECRVDRRAGNLGICRTGENARINSYGPHLGEEDPLRGWLGSGTIFFTGCNLKCQYCQNYEISQISNGEEVTPQELAVIMLEIQSQGCHNINLVSPSHVVPQIIAAVWIAAKAGLSLPLVYNSGGYDSLASLKLLDGIVDIYMPDMKYASPQIGVYYSKVKNYPQINQAAIKEMHRQVGDLQIDAHGLARRGLLVRHLLLPNNLAGTEEILRFLSTEISTNTYLNLMDQYRSAYKAKQFPKLNRRLKAEEYEHAVQLAHQYGLHRLDQRKSLFIIR